MNDHSVNRGFQPATQKLPTPDEILDNIPHDSDCAYLKFNTRRCDCGRGAVRRAITTLYEAATRGDRIVDAPDGDFERELNDRMRRRQERASDASASGIPQHVIDHNPRKRDAAPRVPEVVPPVGSEASAIDFAHQITGGGTPATTEVPGSPETDGLSIICRDCGTLVGGEEAGSRVKWVTCQKCRTALQRRTLARPASEGRDA